MANGRFGPLRTRWPWTVYKGALKHVRASPGTMLICDIEAEDIVAYQRARLSQEASGATINKEDFCLSSILSDHGIWEHVRRDVKKLGENEERVGL